jgi:riboflavin synthase
MFTGLIRELANVKSLKQGTLILQAKYKPNIGDSIAVNGACLTVVKRSEGEFSVELSPETEKLISIKNLKGRVHIEPAMQINDRLEGHIVQGHVDTVGTISKIVNNGNSFDFFVSCERKFIKFMIPKGSVAIDGVSLTINEVYEDSFRLTIIPHTMKNTLFESYQIGREVNIETDMFARYIYNMFGKKDEVSWDKIDSIMASY